MLLCPCGCRANGTSKRSSCAQSTSWGMLSSELCVPHEFTHALGMRATVEGQKTPTPLLNEQYCHFVRLFCLEPTTDRRHKLALKKPYISSFIFSWKTFLSKPSGSSAASPISSLMASGNGVMKEKCPAPSTETYWCGCFR